MNGSNAKAAARLYEDLQKAALGRERNRHLANFYALVALSQGFSDPEAALLLLSQFFPSEKAFC